MRSIQAMALRVDHDGNCCFADENALLPLSGLTEEVFARSPISTILVNEVRQRLPSGVELEKLTEPCEFEFELNSPPSDRVYIRVRLVPVKDNQQNPDGFVIFCYDVSGQKNIELELERKTSSLELLLACTNMANKANEFRTALADCIEIICSYQNWLYAGWLVSHVYLVDEGDPDSLVSSNIWSCKNRESIQAFIDLTQDTRLQKGVGIAGRVLESGKPVWLGKTSSYSNLPRARLAEECGLNSIVAIPVFAGEDIVAVIELFAAEQRPPNDNMLDILMAIGRELGAVYSREKTTQKIQYMADHDALTGLVLTHVIRDRLDRTLKTIARYAEIAAVLFIDLDGFKMVNDAYGHDAGDRLLVHASRVLKDNVRDADTVCRFGGDEFIILLTNLKTADDGVVVAQKILEAFEIPVKVGDVDVRVGASIGIAICDNAEQDVDVVIKKADSAMYKAKNTGKNQYVVSR